ncbi:MAG: STAS domain-containing protein [Phycisphaerae bacterium]|nr:STAS domain-containing protein [Phycisphaerae bacterium]
MNDPADTLQVNTTTASGVPLVSVRGEIDLRSSPILRESLLESAAKLSGPLLIDLSEVSYMDSSGVGTLVFVKREIERSGRRLVLIGLQPRVRSVLEITHLDKFFTIVQSLDEVPKS